MCTLLLEAVTFPIWNVNTRAISIACTLCFFVFFCFFVFLFFFFLLLCFLFWLFVLVGMFASSVLRRAAAARQGGRRIVTELLDLSSNTSGLLLLQ